MLSLRFRPVLSGSGRRPERCGNPATRGAGGCLADEESPLLKTARQSGSIVLQTTFTLLLRDHPYFAISCLTAILSGCVAFTAWIRRASAPATRPFTGLMVAITAQAISAAISAAATSPTSIIAWTTLTTVLSSAITALFFTFSLHFTGRRRWLTRWRRAGIWALPVFNIAFVLTNSWHRLVWTSFTPVENSHVLTFHHGVGYLWLAAWFYVYVLTGGLLVARTALSQNALYRQQAKVVVISTIPPLMCGTLHVLEYVPPGVTLLPMSFLGTGLIYFRTLFRFRLFDLRPVARDTLIETMPDSVLVLDDRGRVIDMNPAACQFVSGRSAHAAANGLSDKLSSSSVEVLACLGQPVAAVLSQWPALVGHCQYNLHLPRNNEVLVTLAGPPKKHLNLRFNTLKEASVSAAHGAAHSAAYGATGKLVIIRDVTAEYQNQVELEQSNLMLKQRLAKIESLQAQLKEQAIRDGLTGLFNRRYFEEALLAEFAKARRAKTPLAVILVDIDHFKRVNDTYGHQAGDRALQVFAKLMRDHVRTSDIACRYGGEEFIVALPGMTLEEGYQRAEKLRIAFKETTIQYENETIQATISGGVGAFPEYEGSQDGLISLVDKALYGAKRNGRDRIFKIQLSNTPPSPPEDAICPQPRLPDAVST